MAGKSRRRSRSRRKPGREMPLNRGAMLEREGVQKKEMMSKKEMMQKKEQKKKGGCLSFFVGICLILLAFSCGMFFGWYRWGRDIGSKVDLAKIEVPDWITQDFIRENIYSRPATSRYTVRDIVVHYVANPGKTAAQNRSYFDGLADQKPGDNTESASSHFIIGLDGEIIQCIPLKEFAYTSNYRNIDTISIECCHPDESGEFTEATYTSLVKLTAWLCDELKISRSQVIRHYDVSGKSCPKYFVDHEEAWETFKKDVEEFDERY